jgi:hypothetical protein
MYEKLQELLAQPLVDPVELEKEIKKAVEPIRYILNNSKDPMLGYTDGQLKGLTALFTQNLNKAKNRKPVIHVITGVRYPSTKMMSRNVFSVLIDTLSDQEEVVVDGEKKRIFVPNDYFKQVVPAIEALVDATGGVAPSSLIEVEIR